VKAGIKIGVVGAVVALAGCTAQAPVSNAGVGFGDYAAYEQERAQREAALTGIPIGAPLTATVPETTIGPNPNAEVIPGVEETGEVAELPEQEVVATADLAAAGIGVTNTPLAPAPEIAPPPLTSGGLANATTVDPTPSNRPLANNPNLSDEQSFDAVTSRETIESDAQRRAQQAQNLVVVEPVPLPQQRANAGPNIVEYAINAPNRKGQPWWSRSILSGDNRFQRNCATYANPDAAQRDFLARGGPERDPRGIDPDGDGFACGWDPAPFKLAAGN